MIYTFCNLLRKGIYLVILFTSLQSFAQNGTSSVVKKDSINHHSPKKAVLMSAILPGLGQVYNKKYWKVPLVYAGISALLYYELKNNSNYLMFRSAYNIKKGTEEGTIPDEINFLDEQALQTWREKYRRSRDLCIIGLFGIYIINIIDANVDAYLFDFDVSDDLSLRIEPTILNTANYNTASVGLKFSIKF